MMDHGKFMFLTKVTIVATISHRLHNKTASDQGNISGWIVPNFDVKINASNSEAENTHLDSGNANENPSACEPNDPALFINRRVTSDVINFLINRPCHPNPTNMRLCVGLR